MFNPRRRTRRFGAVLALAVGGLLGLAPAATAAPCGHVVVNGPIAFGRFDPQLGDFSLWTARADGSHQRRLTTVPSFMSDWRPDGTSLAVDFVDDTGVHIATIQPNGTGWRQLTREPGIQEIPRYSPDGRRIVYDASAMDPEDPAFTTDIWVMDADGSHRHQVTHGGFDVEPVFSPDGRYIAFGRIVGPTSESNTSQQEALYVIRTDGTGLREIVPPRTALEHPRWSPDGRLLTFNIAPEGADAPDAGTVYSVHPDGTGLHVLVAPSDTWAFTKAVWSPDGHQLIVVCSTLWRPTHSATPPTMQFNPDGADNLCTMTPDGRHIHLVVAGTNTQPVNFPSWGPRRH